MSADPLIEARGLVKRFGDFTAVDGIDVEVRAGEAFGFLGPNGAGKSSTMRMIGCTSPPTAGTLRVFGLDVRTHGKQIRARLGVVPQADQLDAELTVAENLIIYGRYFDIPRAECKRRARELLEFVQLTERANSKVDPLSGGMKRRVTIARSLINNPQLLLLDEPTTGLDPKARQGVWRMIRELARTGVTILLTTQYLEEADQLAARIAVIDHGRKIAEGTSRELKALIGSGFLHVAPADPADIDRAAEILEARLGAAVQRSAEGAQLSVMAGTPRDANEALSALMAAGIEISDFSMGSPSLDEVFFALTGQPAEDQDRKEAAQ